MAIVQKKFEFKINNNTTATDAKVALFIGTYPNVDQLMAVYPEVAGMVSDGTILTINEGTTEAPVNKTITASSNSNKTIMHLQNYVGKAIMQLSNLEFVSNDKENFQADVQYVSGSPFNDTRDFSSKRISDYVSPDQFDSNRAICKGVNIPIHAGMILVFSIRAASVLNVSMTFSIAE